jgi:hypothetical protein
MGVTAGVSGTVVASSVVSDIRRVEGAPVLEGCVKALAAPMVAARIAIFILVVSVVALDDRASEKSENCGLAVGRSGSSDQTLISGLTLPSRVVEVL